MRTRTLLAIAVLAATVVGALASHAAQGRAGRTLTFIAPPPAKQDFRQIDLPPRGLSLGDESVGAISLRRHGRLAGRAMIDCTINDSSFEGQQCTLGLVLRQGQITAQTAGLDRPLPHSHLAGDVWAVTGGTGPFTGASGTVTIRHGRPDRVVVALRG